MTATAKSRTVTLAKQIDALDWPRINVDLDAQGWALTGPLISPETCAALAAHYLDDTKFRSHIVMA